MLVFVFVTEKLLYDTGVKTTLSDAHRLIVTVLSLIEEFYSLSNGSS